MDTFTNFGAGWRRPARSDQEAAKAYHDVYRDINFAGHRIWAKLQSTTGKSPLYL